MAGRQPPAPDSRWSAGRVRRPWIVMVLGLLAACTRPDPADVVSLDTGRARGIRTGAVVAFRGLPYAAPPVGERRWQPPAPAATWPGLRDARRFGPSCAQPASPLVALPPGGTAEDCLTLNVLAPAPAPAGAGGRYPVMVWIHGGGYVQGSGNDPVLNSPALPRQGVVLVTVNYRLNVFGFLAHPALATSPAEAAGNYGLLDLLAALRWVQRNIAAFGGDAGNVTIFGESAGADLVNHLLVMPAAADLFHKAISQSSSVGLAPGAYPERGTPVQPAARAVAEAYLARVLPAGVPPDGTRLRALSTQQLLAAYGPRDRFTPVIDGALVPGQVGRLFAAGRQHRVPYLTGGNSWEASLGRAIGGGFSPAIAARLVPPADQARLYPGLAGEALADAIFGDLVILAPARYLAARMQATGVPVHRYYLTYLAEDRRGRQPGVAHADDIAFVMGSLDREPSLRQVTDRDRATSALLGRYWLQFARTGDPNGPGLPHWPRDTVAGTVLEIGDEVVVRDGFEAARLDWHVARGEALLDRLR